MNNKLVTLFVPNVSVVTERFPIPRRRPRGRKNTADFGGDNFPASQTAKKAPPTVCGISLPAVTDAE